MFASGQSGFGSQAVMTTGTPNSLILDPCLTHLASLLTETVSCTVNWLFSLKFLALAIAVWMRNRKTRHYATVVLNKF
jgi:hypothetical protein